MIRGSKDLDSKVHHEDVQGSFSDKMKDLVISTQKKLADWKIKTKGKRFRFQNVQGTILAFCHSLISSAVTLRGKEIA